MTHILRVVLLSPTADKIKLLTTNNEPVYIKRSKYKHFRVGDIVDSNLKLLTDDDEVVKLNHPDRKQLVPYGTFLPVNPPQTIQTP